MAQEMILAKLSQLQGFGEKFIAKMGEVSERVQTLEAVGAQANLIERILVNGDPLSIGANKTVNIPVPTRVNQLENDASYQENVIEHIQVNGVTQGVTDKTVNVHMPTAVSELTNDSNYQTNVLEGVKVNGAALTVDSEKNVNVSVPTKVSQLTNDKTYQTKSEVENTVKTAVAGSKHTSFQKVSSVPAAADAKEDIMYLVMNSVTKHYDIYAKIADDAGNFKMELLDDTTVDLSGYVQKEAGKGLSHNDFTDTLLAKLNGIAEKANLYVHPGHTAYAEGLYKVTVDALGHVTKAAAVTKADITGLGIPGQDTHDWGSITGKPTSYPPSGHTHDDRYYTESELDTKLAGKSATGHKHLWADITNKPSTFAPSAHKHVKADITDFPTSLPASDVKAWAKADTKPSYTWGEITEKPSSYPPASHTHDDRYYTEAEIDQKLKGTSASGHTHAWGEITGKPSTFPPSAHKHVKADISDFPASMPASDVSAWAKAASKPSYGWSEITGKPTSYPPSGHTHNSVKDAGNNSSDTTFAYSKAGMSYGDYTWLAGWNGYEMRAVNKNQFAIAGHGHSSISTAADNRNTNTTPNDYKDALIFQGLKDNSKINSPSSDVYSYLLGLRGWNDSSGGNSHELAFNNTGVYWRNGDTTSWNSWHRIYTDNYHPISDVANSVDWSKVQNKPSTFIPASHTHDDRYYTESETDAKLAKKADTHSHPYLPTAGGNMGGTAMIAWPDSGNWNNSNDGVTFPVKRGGLSWTGQSDGIQLFAEETGSDNLELVLQFMDDNSNGLTIRNKSGAAVSRLDANGGFSGSVAWGNITGKPTTFAPSSHNHDDRYYTESEMDAKLSGTANSVNNFTFKVQTSDPGANSSLTTNQFLFVYE